MEIKKFLPKNCRLARALAIGILNKQLINADKKACLRVNLIAAQSPKVRPLKNQPLCKLL
jgi:hypothetical protein